MFVGLANSSKKHKSFNSCYHAVPLFFPSSLTGSNDWYRTVKNCFVTSWNGFQIWSCTGIISDVWVTVSLTRWQSRSHFSLLYLTCIQAPWAFPHTTVHKLTIWVRGDSKRSSRLLRLLKLPWLYHKLYECLYFFFFSFFLLSSFQGWTGSCHGNLATWICVCVAFLGLSPSLQGLFFIYFAKTQNSFLVLTFLFQSHFPILTPALYFFCPSEYSYKEWWL